MGDYKGERTLEGGIKEDSDPEKEPERFQYKASGAYLKWQCIFSHRFSAEGS